MTITLNLAGGGGRRQKHGGEILTFKEFGSKNPCMKFLLHCKYIRTCSDKMCVSWVVLVTGQGVNHWANQTAFDETDGQPGT